MSQELKVGQRATYEIAGRSLTVKPLPLGKMKRATMVFTETGQDNMDLISRYLLILLDNGSNEGVTLEWIQDNVTIPEAQEMLDASRVINGLGSFFQKGPSSLEGRVEERPLLETPPTPSV